MPSLDEAVTGVLTEVVDRAGLTLDEVTVTSAGRRRVVRVVVDLPDDGARDEPGEVSMDAVATASTAVSEALDASDVLGSAPYTLEVSSPGVDRPLTLPRHWRRARTRLVRVARTDGGELVGRVAEVDDDGVLVLLDPPSVKGRPPRAADVGRPVRLAWAEVARGEVQVEFRRADDDPDDDLADDLADDALDEDAPDDDALDDDENDDDGREDEQ
ncbi:ribosome maturation factor RimP [Kineococcus sp. R8]|uniref:ribosome maturation factor RimP n=1 Tax=Kineococcus siccus TaxID=2696567 RepID=UPI0014121931|nr:ribosome maturation factor RimP [Kineococcus siccus]